MKAPKPSDEARFVVEELLAAKWALAIMRVLAEGPVRFNGIRSAIPAVSANVLTTRLRDLEEAGIICRWMTPPPAECQVYGMTELGEAARPILRAIEQWASLFHGRPERPGHSGRQDRRVTHRIAHLPSSIHDSE